MELPYPMDNSPYPVTNAGAPSEADSQTLSMEHVNAADSPPDGASVGSGGCSGGDGDGDGD